MTSNLVSILNVKYSILELKSGKVFVFHHRGVNVVASGLQSHEGMGFHLWHSLLQILSFWRFFNASLGTCSLASLTTLQEGSLLNHTVDFL